jgi:opacity protein-like surface antigen
MPASENLHNFGPSFIPPGVFSLTRTMTADNNWTGTAVSTVGIAHNNWLIYGKAGVAWAHTKLESRLLAPRYGAWNGGAYWLT